MKDHSIIDQLRTNGLNPFCGCDREECRVARHAIQDSQKQHMGRKSSRCDEAHHDKLKSWGIIGCPICFALFRDYPDETPGTALAREVRAARNKLTAEERAKFRALAMDVINRT